MRDNLPPLRQWPQFLFELPELHYPERLNCAAELLDRNAAQRPAAIAIRTSQGDWTFGRLHEIVNRMCGALAGDLVVKPGNRVLLRGANSPMLMAAWLAVIKVGAVVVTTMPLLRVARAGDDHREGAV